MKFSYESRKGPPGTNGSCDVHPESEVWIVQTIRSDSVYFVVPFPSREHKSPRVPSSHQGPLYPLTREGTCSYKGVTPPRGGFKCSRHYCATSKSGSRRLSNVFIHSRDRNLHPRPTRNKGFEPGLPSRPKVGLTYFSLRNPFPSLTGSTNTSLRTTNQQGVPLLRSSGPETRLN